MSFDNILRITSWSWQSSRGVHCRCPLFSASLGGQ